MKIEKEETKKEKEPDAAAVILGGIFKYIEAHFIPATFTEASIRKTTGEIFDDLQEHFPSDQYDAADIFPMLRDLNFTYECPAGDMHFLWLMKWRQ